MSHAVVITGAAGDLGRALTKRFKGSRRESLLELNKKAVRKGNQFAKKL